MLDLSTFWLKIHYYIISHRADLKKWWVIVLIAVNVFMIVFVFTNAVLFAVSFSRQSKMMVAMADSQVDYLGLRAKSVPLPLEIIDSQALPLPDNKFNLATLIKNPNNNWAAAPVDYLFSIQGQPTETNSDFILPSSQKYLTALGVAGKTGGKASDLSMSVEKISWRRVTNSEKLSAITFEIKDLRNSSAELPSGQIIHRAQAKVINTSFKNFWRTRFAVLFLSGSKLVGIEYLYFDQFKAGEERLLNSQVEAASANLSSVQVVPDFNLLDDSNQMR